MTASRNFDDNSQAFASALNEPQLLTLSEPRSVMVVLSYSESIFRQWFMIEAFHIDSVNSSTELEHSNGLCLIKKEEELPKTYMFTVRKG